MWPISQRLGWAPRTGLWVILLTVRRFGQLTLSGWEAAFLGVAPFKSCIIWIPPFYRWGNASPGGEGRPSLPQVTWLGSHSATRQLPPLIQGCGCCLFWNHPGGANPIPLLEPRCWHPPPSSLAQPLLEVYFLWPDLGIPERTLTFLGLWVSSGTSKDRTVTSPFSYSSDNYRDYFWLFKPL